MSQPEGRIPPYSSEAEAAVLGAILLNNDAMGVVSGILQPEDFYIETNRMIYESMRLTLSEGQALDHVTLGTVMKREGNLEKIGGATGLAGLTDSVATTANVNDYARIVREKAVVRRMIYTAQEIAATGITDYGDVVTYLSNARDSITRAADTLSSGSGPQLIDEDLKQVYLEVSEEKEIRGIVKTGIDIIDEITGGLQPGLLTVLGARPSMGKSAFVVNIAANAALASKKVLYITLEDMRAYTVRRLMARFADIDLHELVLNKLRGDKSRKCSAMVEAITKLSGKPLWIEDAAGMSSAAIRQTAAAHHNLHGLDLIIVDHLGEIADDGESKTAITEDAAKSMRDMAKELNIPVLLPTQLNRNLENRPDKRPNMADLRQSGAIEQVARVVWFLYRPGHYIADCEEAPQCNLIVGKATHGKTGMLNLWCNLSRMYFRGWDTMSDGPFKEIGKVAYDALPSNAPTSGRGSGHERAEPTHEQRDFFGGKKEEY